VKRVRIGCSGWSYADWRGPAYRGAPPSRWLPLYAERFDTVEVNATFYRLPTRRAVEHWVDQTPDGFVFAVKASRYLTHIRRLEGVADGWKRLCERIEPLIDAGRLGPVLWQLPAVFHRDDDRLAAALNALPPARHAFEFRHASWFCPEVEALLRRHGAALAIGDDPSRPFQTSAVTAGFTYLRFHRGTRGRRGNYSPAELDERAREVRRLTRTAEAWAYFNNDWEAFAWRNAAALRRRLGA
jgi:uncharacterized protein YecE (DUF72 family)